MKRDILLNGPNSHKLFNKPGLYAWLTLLAIMIVGTWARWQYIQAGVFQIDEFISMLAIKMILEKGQPVLPSGLYYDHGLAFSYIAAAFSQIAGYNLLAVRWWSLIASVLGIGLSYILAWRLYESHGWGLVTALGLALQDNAIQWGGRSRMYSQANLLLLLWILCVWLGIVTGKRRWMWPAFIIVFWLGVNTHLALLLALPPLLISATIVWLLYKRTTIIWREWRWSDLLPIIAGAVVIAIIILRSQTGFVASYTVDSSIPTSAAAAVNRAPANDVIALEFNEQRWIRMAHYFNDGGLRPFLVLAVIGGLAAVVSSCRSSRSRADLGGLFITLMLIGTLLEMLLLVADQWHQDRYRFLLILPLLLLLAAYGLRAAVHSVIWSIDRLIPNKSRLRTAGAIVTVFLLAIWPMQTPWQKMLEASTGATDTPNQYNLAFAFVDSQRAVGDQLLTVRPAAGYLFSESLNYYVNHSSPVIIPGKNGWIDGYAGVPFLDTIAQLDQVLAEPGKLWFVVDDDRLYSKLEPVFTQHLLNQMEVVQEIGNVLILRESDMAGQKNPEPVIQQTATFASGIKLMGYTLDTPLCKGCQKNLITFWQNARFIYGYKVFVHLRDQTGQLTAQADFAPLDQFDPKLRDRLTAYTSSELIQLQTTLSLPLDAEAGPYDLYLGIYNATTQERIPVVDSTTGENEIFLGQVDLR